MMEQNQTETYTYLKLGKDNKFRVIQVNPKEKFICGLCYAKDFQNSPKTQLKARSVSFWQDMGIRALL